jgi:hypothetical protein
MPVAFSFTPAIKRDPPPETPTEVAPLIVYPAASTGGSLAGVQIVGYRDVAGGTVEAARFNAAEVNAANYIRDHVHLNIDPKNSIERALADGIIETLFNDLRNAALAGPKTFQDALGNIYRGSDLITLMKNVDINIFDPTSAAAANISTLRGAQTAHDNFSNIQSHATITFELGGLQSTLGSTAFTDGGVQYAVNHELGHALPAGHQVALLDWTTFLQNGGNQLTGAAQDAAWQASSYFADQEAFANTFGHEIATFTGSGWLTGAPPSYGYWHGVM